MLKVFFGLSILVNIGLVAFLQFSLNWGSSFDKMSDSQKKIKCISYIKDELKDLKSEFSTKRVRPRRTPSRPVQGFENAPQQIIRVRKQEIDQQLQNLPRVLQGAKVVPHVEPGSGGSISGFKVVSIKPGSVYERLEIKRGDVVKGLNGKAMDSPQKAMEMYQSLKKGGPVKIQIMRDGEPKVLNYQIEKQQ